MRARMIALLSGVILVALTVGFLAGSTLGAHTGTSLAQATEPPDVAAAMNDFWQAYNVLNTDSYWAPFNHNNLIYAAINGMLTDGTSDPHTQFFSPQENSVEQSGLQGSFD